MGKQHGENSMELQKEGWNGFIELCLSIKDRKTLSSLFDLFLTPEEKNDLSTRFLLVKELLEGDKTQRQIAEDLSISIAKITRGSNELKRFDKSFLNLLQQKIK